MKTMLRAIKREIKYGTEAIPIGAAVMLGVPLMAALATAAAVTLPAFWVVGRIFLLVKAANKALK